MLKIYYDKPIIFDFLFNLLIVAGIYFLKPYIQNHFHISSIDMFNKLSESIVRVSSSIIGFLLTVTTVIVTFKRGFLEKQKKDEKKPEQSDFSEIPTSTVFDKKASKEHQFYGTNLHKKVANVFIGATFEIGFVLFLLLSLQLNVFNFPNFAIECLILTSLLLLTLSVIRSFYIFQLFLKVHLEDEKETI